MNFPGRFFEGTLWLRGLEGFRGAPSCWEFHISSFYFHVVRFCTILCNFFWWCPRWSHLDSFHQLGFISPISSMYSTLLNYEPNSRAEPCSKAAKKPVKPIAAVVASCHSELGRARRCIGTTCVICVFRGFLSIFLQNRLELELVWLVWGFGSTITKVRQMHVWYGIWDIIEIRSAWKGCLLPLSGTWKHKLPGGWETALAVEHVLKKGSGSVAPCVLYKSCFYDFSRGKSSNVEVISWYLQGFVALGWWSFFTSEQVASVCQAFA